MEHALERRQRGLAGSWRRWAPSMTPPRLYYMPRTRSSRVLWLLEEIGAPYELTELRGAERRSDEHLRRHPLGRVPGARARGWHDDVRVRGDLPPASRSEPRRWTIGAVGSPERGLVYQWVVSRSPNSRGRVSLDSRLGEGVIGSPAHDRFAEAAVAMQSALVARDWLVDDRFSVAEVMCASVLQGANARELLRPWPGLEAYVQRGEARPAYARAAAISDRPRS